MSRNPTPKASNRELRTRKDLLHAADRLLRQGKLQPSMDEVAKEALVSRATAYRYFRSVEDLLAEAPVDAAVREPAEMLAGASADDPLERIETAEAALHEVTFANEAALRIVLARSILREGDMPRRQNRRMPLIEAALEPARKSMRPKDYKNLCAVLGMLFGTEAMIASKDVLGIDGTTARKAKSWAIRVLVEAALTSKA